MAQEIQQIRIEDLSLWTENPRDPIENTYSDVDIISKALVDDNGKWNLKKLSKEMGAYYDLSELPTVVNIDGKYIVYDGNRRVAILKYLQNKDKFPGLELKFSSDPIKLLSLDTIPCNVCDLDTALTNVERKHTNSGTWDALETAYFSHLHRNQEKSLFLWLEEQTGGMISRNPKLNKDFVRDEIFTKDNLKKIGYNFDKNTGFKTNYTKDQSDNIFKNITTLINNNEISTRKNRRQLLKPLLEHNPDLSDVIKAFDETKPIYDLKEVSVDGPTKARKTQRTRFNDVLFGKVLTLQMGKVNDLYVGISHVYNKNPQDNSILPIIGMSLRLLLETAAREYYKSQGSDIANIDQIYKKFLSQAKLDMQTSKEQDNFFSLTNSWLEKGTNIEGILGKFAHGNIITLRSDVITQSHVIADILEFYFKKI